MSEYHKIQTIKCDTERNGKTLLEGQLIPISVKRPKARQDCIVLTDCGKVTRALAHSGWAGGFCEGDGKDGFAVQNVTHWMPFVPPNANGNVGRHCTDQTQEVSDHD